jgi:predicted nucleic acid-binding protein
MTRWYIESSALVKVVHAEAETPKLRAFLLTVDDLVTSALARTEVMRACRRTDPNSSSRVEAVLGAVSTIVAVDDVTLADAAHLEPPSLRSLDAIHVASARRVRGEVEGVITYDSRLAEAAADLGMAVASPGR